MLNPPAVTSDVEPEVSQIPSPASELPLLGVPLTWDEMLLDLANRKNGPALRAALVKIAGKNGPTVHSFIRAAWRQFLDCSSGPKLCRWPLNLEWLRQELIEPWVADYRAWQLSEVLKPAVVLTEDWRYQIAMRWQEVRDPQTGSLPLDTTWPSIRVPQIECDLIPDWVEDRTFLVLLPAPMNPQPYLPVVIQGPPGVDPLGYLDLEAHGALFRVDRPMDLAFSPANEEDRMWLLRLAHHQGAAWISSPSN